MKITMSILTCFFVSLLFTARVAGATNFLPGLGILGDGDEPFSPSGWWCDQFPNLFCSSISDEPPDGWLFFWKNCQEEKEVNKELQAIVDFYYATGNTETSGPLADIGWLKESCSPCDYTGIQCNLGKVVEIDLSLRGLTGTIPASIGNLKNLIRLDLSLNDMTGPLPEDLGKCKDLQHLNLMRNEFTGTVPDKFGGFEALETLLLHKNSLTGTMPEKVCELRSLLNLNVLISADCAGRVPEIFCDRFTCCSLCYRDIFGNLLP